MKVAVKFTDKFVGEETKKMVKNLQQTELEKSIDFFELIKQDKSIGEIAYKFNMEYVEVRRILHLNPEYSELQKKMRNAKLEKFKEKQMAASQKSY